MRGQSGAVLVVQRTSSDLRLNPHVHAVFLDGIYQHAGEEAPRFLAPPKLSIDEVAGVLEDAMRRITRYLRRRGLLADDGDWPHEGGAWQVAHDGHGAQVSSEPRSGSPCKPMLREAGVLKERGREGGASNRNPSKEP